MRRGRPTLHVVAGEGHGHSGRRRPADRGVRAAGPRCRQTADPAIVARKLRVIGVVAVAAGRDRHGRRPGARPRGSRRPAGHRSPLDADALRVMHAKKTGALIRASAVAGAIMGGAADAIVDRVDAAAADFGLAFQIVDDILDVEGASARSSARPPARTPRPASRPIRRCTAWTPRGRWPPSACERAERALATAGLARVAADGHRPLDRQPIQLTQRSASISSSPTGAWPRRASARAR